MGFFFIRTKIGHSNVNRTLKTIEENPTGLCEDCQVEPVVHVLMGFDENEQERQGPGQAGIPDLNSKTRMKLPGGPGGPGSRRLFVIMRHADLDLVGRIPSVFIPPEHTVALWQLMRWLPAAGNNNSSRSVEGQRTLLLKSSHYIVKTSYTMR